MYSKLLCPTYRLLSLRTKTVLLGTIGNAALPAVQKMRTRTMSMIPKSQYDTPFPDRLRLGYVMSVYWEIIPVIAVTAFALTLLFISIMWAFGNKVDVVFQTHSRECISRTMDLREPTVHKLITINQKYEPWIEMAELLDKVKAAEKKLAAGC